MTRRIIIEDCEPEQPQDSNGAAWALVVFVLLIFAWWMGM